MKRLAIRRPVKFGFAGLLVLAVLVGASIWLLEGPSPSGTFFLEPQDWPATAEETASDVLPWLSRYQKLEIRFMKKSELNSLHFGIGLGIRNRYGLWRGNEKLLLSACGHRCQPDDASEKILEVLWDQVQQLRWWQLLAGPAPVRNAFVAETPQADQAAVKQ